MPTFNKRACLQELELNLIRFYYGRCCKSICVLRLVWLRYAIVMHFECTSAIPICLPFWQALLNLNEAFPDAPHPTFLRLNESKLPIFLNYW